MGDVETTRVARQYKKAGVTRLINKLKRVQAEGDVARVKENYELLVTAFDKFEEAHSRYHDLLDAEAIIEASDSYFFEVEDNYTQAITVARGWLRVNDGSGIVKDTDIKPPQAPVIHVNTDNHSAEIISLLNLPRVEIEPFDGDVMKYHAFMAVFDESVDKVLQDSNSKLIRLIQYTRGRAKEAIQSCSLIGGDEGYKQARDILWKRFGNDFLVTERIVREIRNGKPVRNADDLQKLSDDLSNCMRTLERMKKMSEIDSQSCIVDVINRVQPYIKTRWKKYAIDMKRKHDNYPKFKDLVQFIADEAEEANDPVFGNINSKPLPEKTVKSKDSKIVGSKTVSVFSSGTAPLAQYKGPPCVACKGDHRLLFCDAFRAMKVDQRIALVKENKLCENCLIANHTAMNCKKSAICTVPGCGLKHTRYIHTSFTGSRARNAHVETSRAIERSTPASVSSITSANTNCVTANSASHVCVPVVSVKVNSVVDSVALLDFASNSSFCTRRLVNRLGISGERQEYFLNTVSQSDERRFTEVVKLKLESVDGSECYEMSHVFVVDNIPVCIPEIDTQRYPHLRDIDVPVPGSEVDILIGQDNSEALIPLETRKGVKYDPFAVKTIFGWSINGPCKAAGAVSGKTICHFVTTSSVEQDVKKLWEIEGDSLARDVVSWSLEDKHVISMWDAEHKFVEGHYELPIPWKESVFFPNNYPVALSRLKSNVNRLKKSGLFEQYDGEISKLLKEGYAEPVSMEGDFGDKLWYLPHQAVLSEQKPGKLRVVYDCASKYQGQSLNDKCYQGPDLNNKLFNVLLRFRNHTYAVMADIQSMYYQVKVPTRQRDCLRFLWLDQGGGIVQYRMTSHVFGGIWCACAATYALRRTLVDFDGYSDQVKSAVQNDFYVDDCLMSFENHDTALKVITGVTNLLKDGGFHLTKFVANSDVLLSHIPTEQRATEVKDLQPSSYSKVLGVKWDVWNDCLNFNVSCLNKDALSKRAVLSVTSSLFDPLGLVGPVLIRGRILFQEATRLNIGWDDQLPVEFLKKWGAWVDSLADLSLIQISRCVKPCNFSGCYLELHHFSDASEVAYGCCSYLRCISDKGEIKVSLLCSKSRVSPLKATTIPRLELQAALLAARIDATLRIELHLDLGKSQFWVDNETVIKYINNDSRRFQVFVANRVAEIRTLTDPEQWHHVPGHSNPADIISRGANVQELSNGEWFYGPSFLHTYKSNWEMVDVSVALSDDDQEVRKSKTHKAILSCFAYVSTHPLDKLISYYSSWLKLKRAVAWWLRLKQRLRGVVRASAVTLSADEIQDAEVLILKHVQSQVYGEELICLIKNDPVQNSSSLRSLMPTLDDQGVICVGGRLANADLPSSGKHPCIVPHTHPVARLIIAEYHNKAHLGIEWVLSLIRQKFWITKARMLIKQVKYKCVICKKLYGNPATQLMADLPVERTEAGKPPFYYVGIDCFGPIKVKQGRSQIKRYGCLFTCFCTRAVHIEKLSGLDSDAFLNGFRRFVARRGQPKKVWSDNGTNFVGGLSELQSCMKAMDWALVQSYCANHGIEWNFIPPGAPHMGGLWERMVRSVKRVLAAIMGSQSLYDDVLETLLCEVESVINSRPITKTSDDPNDHSALSPSHLLLLREGPPSPLGKFEGGDTYRRRWRHVQALADMFWKRWVKEYLSMLQGRSKWTKIKPNIQVGDVVLVAEENTPRGLWPLGLVVQVDPGSDELVRSVKVKTRSTVLIRPITKLITLESSGPVS